MQKIYQISLQLDNIKIFSFEKWTELCHTLFSYVEKSQKIFQRCHTGTIPLLQCRISKNYFSTRVCWLKKIGDVLKDSSLDFFIIPMNIYLFNSDIFISIDNISTFCKSVLRECIVVYKCSFNKYKTE